MLDLSTSQTAHNQFINLSKYLIMKPTYFSLDDLASAKWVLETQDINTFDHGYAQVSWAKAVVEFWNAFWKVARLFKKEIGKWRLSIKGVWDCIREFKNWRNIFQLLKEMRIKTAQRTVALIQQYKSQLEEKQVRSLTNHAYVIRPKSAKWQMRMNLAERVERTHSAFSNGKKI